MQFWGTCVVVKDQKRLHIDILETGLRLYTPPDFIKLPSREPLKELANNFTESQNRDISKIITFESTYTNKTK
jgi:hypothetical protein